MPATIEIKEIVKTHKGYNADQLVLYSAVYEGGELFDKHKDQLLDKRAIEKDKPKVFEKRKEVSRYINRANGLFNLFRSSVFKAPPIISTDPETEYWDELNLDADGNGKPLATVAKEALQGMLLHNRAYFIADFRQEEGRGPRDARLRVLTADVVDNWQHDEFGKLLWVRLHTVTQEREDGNDFLTPDIDCHRYTYIDSESITIYEVKVQAGDTVDTSQKPAAMVLNEQHDFGQLPVFEVKPFVGQFVMEQLYPVAVGLYNRESALTFQLNRQAFGQPILKLETPDRIEQVMAGETEVLVLGLMESFEYATVPASPSDSMLKDIERLTKSIYEVVNSLALTAQTQNARQSAKAKELDRSPFEVLLQSFAWPVQTALRNWINAVQEFRDEQRIEISLSGVDDFTMTEEDVKESIGLDKELEEDDGGTREEPKENQQ